MVDKYGVLKKRVRFRLACESTTNEIQNISGDNLGVREQGAASFEVQQHASTGR